MSHIYIALVDTPGFFAALIRRYVKQRYIHVVISEEPTFKEAYSIQCGNKRFVVKEIIN